MHFPVQFELSPRTSPSRRAFRSTKVAQGSSSPISPKRNTTSCLSAFAKQTSLASTGFMSASPLPNTMTWTAATARSSGPSTQLKTILPPPQASPEALT